MNIESNHQQNIDIRELFLVLLRHKKTIAIVTGFCVGLMVIFLLIQTPIYKTKSVIQINVKDKQSNDLESIMSGVSSQEPAIQSEIDIIASRALATRVVDKLSLITDIEFNPDLKLKKSWIANLFSFGEKTPEELEKEARIAKMKTIDKVSKNLEVIRKPKSYTVEINFKSSDPKKAALIANGFVDEYLISHLSSQFDLTKRANDWLNNKMGDLQKQLQQSEMAVQIFREQNDLIEADGVTINDQQLSELNTQLVLASTALAQAEARLHSAGYATESTSEVLNSGLIQNLRQQEAEVLRKQSDLRNRYGSRHPKMINVDAELRDLREKIQIEINKIKIGLKKEVEISRVREDSLRKTLEKLQGKAGKITKDRIQLDELIRQRDADKTLYESFLLRAKETGQNKDMEQFNATVISAAEIPIKPAYPKKFLMLAVSIIIGGGLGVIAAFLLEHLDNSFKNGDELEKETNIPSIGLVPKLPDDTNLIDYILSKPSSVFSESLRHILNSIHFSNPDHIPKSILVTSSVPNEGKSTFSIALSALLAKSGKKILLIDGDLRKPSITKRIGYEKVKFGLADYLAGDVDESEVINIDKKTNIHFISSNTSISNSRDLLSSKKMKEFIEKMSEKYDMVIVDSAPVMAISDPVIIAQIVDSVVFMVNWSKTPKPVIKNALKKLSYDNIRFAGTVLNCVDLEKMEKYSAAAGYYYGNYKQYYSE